MLDRIPDGRRVSIERETFPAMVADGTLYGYATDDYWLDTGRPDQYLQANLDLLDGVRRGPPIDPLDAGAVLDPRAAVVRSVVGAGVPGGRRGPDLGLGAAPVGVGGAGCGGGRIDPRPGRHRRRRRPPHRRRRRRRRADPAGAVLDGVRVPEPQ